MLYPPPSLALSLLPPVDFRHTFRAVFGPVGAGGEQRTADGASLDVQAVEQGRFQFPVQRQHRRPEPPAQQRVVGAVVDLPALIVVHLALDLPHDLPNFIADLHKLVMPIVGINSPQIDCFHRLTS